MTSIEKNILTAIVICIVLFFASCGFVIYKVQEAGGLKAVVIDAGKEVKDIGREIAKD